MRQSCNEQMNMKSDSQFFCPESSYFILFYHILQVKLHWMSQSETLEQLVIFRRGLVEVQIAATVATASYRNFSVATKLGKARRLHSWHFMAKIIFAGWGSEVSAVKPFLEGRSCGSGSPNLGWITKVLPYSWIVSAFLVVLDYSTLKQHTMLDMLDGWSQNVTETHGISGIRRPVCKGKLQLQKLDTLDIFGWFRPLGILVEKCWIQRSLAKQVTAIVQHCASWGQSSAPGKSPVQLQLLLENPRHGLLEVE